MASFLNANLPSSDEEDDEYDPTKDPTGEKEDGAAAATRRKRSRCMRMRAILICLALGPPLL